MTPMDILTVPQSIILQTISDGILHLDLDGLRLSRPFTIHTQAGGFHYCWANVQPNGDALPGHCPDTPPEFAGSPGAMWFDPEDVLV